MKVTIPLSGLNGDRFSKNNIYSGIFCLVFNIIVCSIMLVLVGDFIVKMRQDAIYLEGLVWAVIMLPLWAISFSMLLGFVWQNLGQIYISIDRNYFKVSKRLFGFGLSQQGTTASIKKVEGESNDYEVRGYNLTYCTIKGEKNAHFGVGITQVERDWLTAEIKDFVAELQSKHYSK